MIHAVFALSACIYALSIPVPSGLVYAARHGFLLHVGDFFHKLPTYVDTETMQVEKRDGMLRFTFDVIECNIRIDEQFSASI